MTPLELQLPEYGGQSIANLMASLGRACGGQSPYPDLAQLPADALTPARNLILLVIDGLGDDHLLANPQARRLNQGRQGRMTSVFPSTTASAITTFLTGLAPRQHGLTGWFMHLRELDRVMAVLPGQARGEGWNYLTGGVDVAVLYGNSPFSALIQRTAHNLSPDFISNSPYNVSLQGSSRMHAYTDLTDMARRLGGICRQPGEKYVYAYWPKLDSTGHHHGMGSPEAKACLQEIEYLVERLEHELAGTDSLLLVTADHGQIDTEASDRLHLDDHPALAEMLQLPLCGEPRAAYAYLKAGRDAAFRQYMESELGHAVELHPSEDLIRDGWYGPPPSRPELAGRCGDYCLVMRDRYTLQDRVAGEQRHVSIGTHGGISSAEMWVPLIRFEFT